MTTTLELTNLSYTYRLKRASKTVLKDVDFAFEAGKTYAITGQSGAGKTTLLALMAGLDEPTAGSIRFRGEDIQHVGLNAYRRRHTATIFQDLNLLDYLTPVENVTAGMELSGAKNTDRAARAAELLEHLGVPVEDHRRSTSRLSGGQQQRVAIARAIACDVDVLLADEPTGSLDQENAEIVISAVKELARERGWCVVIVTHSRSVARRCDVVVRLQRGRLTKGTI
jgi:putative ABC transport system ATP-binding protein